METKTNENKHVNISIEMYLGTNSIGVNSTHGRTGTVGGGLDALEQRGKGGGAGQENDAVPCAKFQRGTVLPGLFAVRVALRKRTLHPEAFLLLSCLNWLPYLL